MSVFDAIDFYPTPSDLVWKMLLPYRLKIKDGSMSILEPSAGEGAILKYLSEINGRNNKIFAFEQNEQLATIAGSIKGVRMLGNDFMQYTGGHFFDLIAMNPPFSVGDKHLLKAWDVLHSGHIVCLLNEETIKNPHTETRRTLARIIKEHGSVEYLGNCFASASRKTNVRVAMVRLEKKAESSFFDFEKMGLDSEGKPFAFNFSGENMQQITTNDMLGNMELCFNELQKGLAEMIRAFNKIDFYAKSLGFEFYRCMGEYCKAGSYSFKDSSNKFNPFDTYNNFLSDANSAAWKKVFNILDVEKRLTSDFKQNFEKYRNSKEAAQFNKANVLQVLQFLFENQNSIVQNCINSVFDKLTQYSEKNIEQNKQWKTNSHYKVNRKVIVPDCGRWENNAWGGWFSSVWHGSKFYEWVQDIDIACCYLSGKNIDTLARERTIEGAISQHVKLPNFWEHQQGESEFFTFKVFKKGTVHLTFKDEKLWEAFNVAAFKGKNWLTDETEQPKERKKRTKKEE